MDKTYKYKVYDKNERKNVTLRIQCKLEIGKDYGVTYNGKYISCKVLEEL